MSMGITSVLEQPGDDLRIRAFLCRMPRGVVPRRGLEWGAVGLTEGLGGDQRVVGGQHQPRCPILAEGALLVLPQHREGAEDVLDLAAAEPVEEEVRGVEFGAQLCPPLGIPAEGRAGVAEVARERREVPRRVDQLERPYLLTSWVVYGHIECTPGGMIGYSWQLVGGGRKESTIGKVPATAQAHVEPLAVRR